MTELVESHGVMVIAGQVKASDFVKGFSTRVGPNSYFAGTWEELEMLTQAHLSDWEPGTGSVNGDVRLVNVPADRFFTSVTEITPENEHLIETVEVKRQEGEKPYEKQILRGEKPPAKTAQIVIYRADVLAQDNDRSTEAEWEIVSVNAGPGYDVPMTPTTMLRNANNDAGGTYREYTEAQWEESFSFWDRHVHVMED